jgi:hypothetical protein
MYLAHHVLTLALLRFIIILTHTNVNAITNYKNEN